MASNRKGTIENFDSALAYFQAHSFDVQQAPRVANQMEVRKHGCGAVLTRTADGGVAYVTKPGVLVGGEIATLVDRGYQKFLTTSRTQVAATADRLKDLHAFQEEVLEAVGKPDYYNLALGTVSEVYLYDRLRGREPDTEATPGSH